MSELWGFQSGQSQGQADVQSKGLYELRMAEGAQTLEGGAIDIKTKQLTYQNAALMQTRQEQAIKMMQLANAKDSPGTPTHNPAEDISNTLLQMADIDIKSGLPEQGLAAIKQATALQTSHAKIIEQTTQNEIRRSGYIANLLTDVHDQAGWDQAKMIFQSNFPDSPIPPQLANLPYSATLVKSLANANQTQLQKAQAKMDAAHEAEYKANTKALESRPALTEAQTRYYKVRTDAIEKNGGGDKLPKANEIGVARDLINSTYDDVEKADANVNATRVAELADKYQKEQGLSQQNALNAAFRKAQQEGWFLGLSPKKRMGGESFKNAIPLPLDKDKNPDTSQMKPNKIYDGASKGWPGTFYTYDAARGGLVRIQPPKETPPPAKETTSDDDDQDDENE